MAAVAAEFVRTCCDELDTPDARREFWPELVDILGDQLRRPEPAAQAQQLVPMTDIQAKAFGATVMQWGLHRGKRVDEVPLDYLGRLAWDDNGFIRQLKRYLTSKRIQAEQ